MDSYIYIVHDCPANNNRRGPSTQVIAWSCTRTEEKIRKHIIPQVYNIVRHWQNGFYYFSLCMFILFMFILFIYLLFSPADATVVRSSSLRDTCSCTTVPCLAFRTCIKYKLDYNDIFLMFLSFESARTVLETLWQCAAPDVLFGMGFRDQSNTHTQMANADLWNAFIE